MTQEDYVNRLMSTSELNSALAPMMNFYQGNSLTGMSYLDQFKNARLSQSRLDALRNNPYNIYGQVSDSDYNNMSAMFNSNKSDALLGMAGSVGNGVLQIGNNIQSTNQPLDLDYVTGQANDISRIGTKGYGSFGQIANDYENRFNYNIPNFNDVKMTGGEWASSIGSSALAGANAGKAFGLEGMLIGAAVGGLGQAVGNYFGEQNKKSDILHRGRQIKNAASDARVNTGAAIEGQTNYAFGKGVARAVADGGKIERNPSLKEFADSVLAKQKQNDMTHSSGIKREYCKGGLRIRIQR